MRGKLLNFKLWFEVKNYMKNWQKGKGTVQNLPIKSIEWELQSHAALGTSQLNLKWQIYLLVIYRNNIHFFLGQEKRRILNYLFCGWAFNLQFWDLNIPWLTPGIPWKFYSCLNVNRHKQKHTVAQNYNLSIATCSGITAIKLGRIMGVICLLEKF